MSLNILKEQIQKSIAFLDALGMYVHFQWAADMIKETFETNPKTITNLKY